MLPKKRKGPAKRKAAAKGKAASKATADPTAQSTVQAPVTDAADPGPLTWEHLTLSRLKTECKERQITIKGNSSKKQIVTELGNVAGKLATSSKAIGESDYLVERLEDECKALGIVFKGFKKGQLVTKLQERRKLNEDQAASASQAAGATTSQTQSKTLVKWSDKDLVPRLKEVADGYGVLGKLRKKADIVSAIQKYEAIFRDPYLATLRSAEGQTPSPTTSEGPGFSIRTEVPAEAIEAARLVLHPGFGKGFTNETNAHCYRNATLVMLLHSNRFLSWIQEWYIPKLVEADLEPRTYCGPLIDEILDSAGDWIPEKKKELLRSVDNYTDLWCEFHKLSSFYWSNSQPSQEKIDAAKKVFWDYVTSTARTAEFLPNNRGQPLSGPEGIRDQKKHQDAAEFLGWLIMLGSDQLRTFCMDDANQDSDLSAVYDLDMNELLRVSQTQHFRCILCEPQVKNRIALDEQYVLQLAVALDTGIPKPGNREEKTVTIEECLEANRKTFQDGGRCSTCYDKWDTEKQAKKGGATTTDEAMEVERFINNRDKYSNRITTYGWKGFCRLPEVLFISLTRFEGTGKAETCVDFKETLDLEPFLDKSIRPVGTSKYQLVGIVNHQGTLDAGHYHAQICRDGKWFDFDDQEVNETTFDRILDGQKRYQKGNARQVPLGLRWTPYVLMYEKIIEGDVLQSGNGTASGDGKGNGRGNGKRNDNGGSPKSKYPQHSGMGLDGANDNDPPSNQSTGAHHGRSNLFRPMQNLFSTATVQGLLGGLFHKIQKHYYNEVTNDVRLQLQQHVSRIHNLESTVSTLAQDNRELRAVLATTRKRRLEQIEDDNVVEDDGKDGHQGAKRARRACGESEDNDADTEFSDGNNTMEEDYDPESDPYHTPSYMTDSGSVAMSESVEGEYVQNEEPEVPFQADVEAEDEAAVEKLMQEVWHGPGNIHERQARVAADQYAQYHGIDRGQTPWWWMGPIYDQDFRATLTRAMEKKEKSFRALTKEKVRRWRAEHERLASGPVVPPISAPRASDFPPAGFDADGLDEASLAEVQRLFAEPTNLVKSPYLAPQHAPIGPHPAFCSISPPLAPTTPQHGPTSPPPRNAYSPPTPPQKVSQAPRYPLSGIPAYPKRRERVPRRSPTFGKHGMKGPAQMPSPPVTPETPPRQRNVTPMTKEAKEYFSKKRLSPVERPYWVN